MRLVGKRRMQRVVDAGFDKVIGGFPIPAGGKLNGVHLKVHIIGDFTENVETMSQYAITGYVFPIHEPMSSQSYDDIWDKQVPKDVAMSGVAGTVELDLDEDAAVPAAEVEVGLLNPSRVFDLGRAPHRFFKRESELTFSNTPKGDTSNSWYVTDFFASQVRKQVRVQVPSVALVGMSMPDMEIDMSNLPFTLNTAQEWANYTYLGDTVKDAMKDVIGTTELGAESPFEDAMKLLEELLEMAPYEETAGSYLGSAEAATYKLKVWCKSSWDVSVPGYMRAPGTLTSG